MAFWNVSSSVAYNYLHCVKEMKWNGLKFDENGGNKNAETKTKKLCTWIL